MCSRQDDELVVSKKDKKEIAARAKEYARAVGSGLMDAEEVRHRGVSLDRPLVLLLRASAHDRVESS